MSSPITFVGRWNFKKIHACPLNTLMEDEMRALSDVGIKVTLKYCRDTSN